MANNIEMAKQYTSLLSEAFGEQSLTEALNGGRMRAILEGAAANEVKIPVISTDGLGDYDRSTGYPSGAVSLEFKTVSLTQDRGRQFTIDWVDNLESLGLPMAQLLGDFQRMRVVPEVDAYRFSKIALGSKPANRAYAALTTSANVEKAINEAGVVLDNSEVPREGRFLFVTPAVLNLLKAQISRFVQNDETSIKREVLRYDGMEVVSVPISRFYSGITVGSNGYTNAGSALNFMVVYRDSVIPVVKHQTLRIFEPSVNQDADAYKVDYRLYHDLFVMPNKEDGIYVHSATEIAA